MRIAIAIGAGCLLVSSLAGAECARVTFTYLDLQPQANQNLDEGMPDDSNNLAALPKGEQALAGIKFKIGDRLIQLRGTVTPDRPEKVKGIKVGRKFAKLHILHATQRYAEDGAIIGYYTVQYEDKSEETIPIVYGKDVRDWWEKEGAKPPSRGKVAWRGKNDSSKIRLYATTWKNPEPAKKVVRIEFGSTNYTEAAPFCVAMTVEE